MRTVVVIALFAVPMIAVGQQRDCSVDLLKDRLEIKYSEQDKIAILQLVDKDVYQNTKSSQAAALSALGLVSAVKSADEYSTLRDHELSRYEYNYSHDQLNYYLSNVASANGLTAYKECLRSLSHEGLVIAPTALASEEFMEVGIEWESKVHVLPRRLALTLDYGHNKTAADVIPTKEVQHIDGAWMWPNHTHLTMLLPRHPSVDVVLRFSIAETTASLGVERPVAPVMRKCNDPVLSPDPGRAGGQAYVDFDHDGCRDYCRVVGSNDAPKSLLCDLGYRGSVAPPAKSVANSDFGYDGRRLWFEYKGTLALCVQVGTIEGVGTNYVICWPTTEEFTFGRPWRYPDSSESGYSIFWSDANGDGIPDLCRSRGDIRSPSTACQTTDATWLPATPAATQMAAAPIVHTEPRSDQWFLRWPLFVLVGIIVCGVLAYRIFRR